MLGYSGNGKAFKHKNLLPDRLRESSYAERQRLGREENFFDGLHAEDKNLFEHVVNCGDRPQDCIPQSLYTPELV